MAGATNAPAVALNELIPAIKRDLCAIDLKSNIPMPAWRLHDLRRPLRAVLSLVIKHHPHRPLANLR
jgi:hypothetical protein